MPEVTVTVDTAIVIVTEALEAVQVVMLEAGQEVEEMALPVAVEDDADTMQMGKNQSVARQSRKRTRIHSGSAT